MSKKKKQRAQRKNLLEFEIKNSQEVKLPGIGKSSESEKIEEEYIVEEIEVEKDEKIEEDMVKEAEVEKREIVLENVTEEEMDESVDVAKEETTEKPLTEKQKNRKIDKYIEFILIFILGVLIGIAFKTEAEKRITIGFDDYQMKVVQQDYDINKIQFEVTKKSIEESKAQAGEEGAIDEVTSQVEE